MPIHDLSTFAALWITPWRTTPGNVTPTGPLHAKCSTSWATTSAIASGVDGLRRGDPEALVGQLALDQVDRSGLHARPADVDAERLLHAHDSEATRPVRPAQRRPIDLGGRGTASPAAGARPGSHGSSGAGHRPPGRLGEERLGLGQHVLRLPGRADVDDDRAARRRRVDRRPRRRAPAIHASGVPDELGVARHPAVLVLPRRQPVAGVRARHRVPLGADGDVADVPRHRDRRHVAAVAAEDVRGQLGGLGVLHRRRRVLGPGVPAVAAPAAVEEPVGARRRRRRDRHRVVAAGLHRPDRRQDRAELGAGSARTSAVAGCGAVDAGVVAGVTDEQAGASTGVKPPGLHPHPGRRRRRTPAWPPVSASGAPAVRQRRPSAPRRRASHARRSTRRRRVAGSGRRRRRS